MIIIIVLSISLVGFIPTSYGYTDCDGVEDGDVVIVDYNGTISGGERDGESFDSGNHVQFTISRGNLIEGFYEGVLGMVLHEEKTIVIPPEKGYSGTHDLAGETLVFDTLLVGVISEINNCNNTSSSAPIITTSNSTEALIIGTLPVSIVSMIAAFIIVFIPQFLRRDHDE